MRSDAFLQYPPVNGPQVHRDRARDVLLGSEFLNVIKMHRDNSETKLGNGTPKNGTSTVCLVDDDPSVLKATGRLVASAGWNVESFTDPNEFLRYSKNHGPPAAVIDVLMPDMNGLDVQAQLRSISPSTQVIMLTSVDDPLVRTKAMNAGASAFLLKPVDDEEFLARVASAMSKN